MQVSWLQQMVASLLYLPNLLAASTKRHCNNIAAKLVILKYAINFFIRLKGNSQKKMFQIQPFCWIFWQQCSNTHPTRQSRRQPSLQSTPWCDPEVDTCTICTSGPSSGEAPAFGLAPLGGSGVSEAWNVPEEADEDNSGQKSKEARCACGTSGQPNLVQWESSRVHALIDQPVYANLSPLPLAVNCPGQDLVNLKGTRSHISAKSGLQVQRRAGESLLLTIRCRCVLVK